MAITVADNFSYQGGKPLDARIKFNSISAMVETPAASLYDGCFAYVTAEKKYYSYDSTNQEDVTLGKWREYSSGGGGLTQTIRYNIVTKSTGNYDASITVNKYVDDELESSTDYLYSSLQTAVVIDHRIQLQYYSMNYHLTLLADSTTEQAGYTTQWAYNATVDLDQSFISEAYKPYVVEGYFNPNNNLFYEDSQYTTAISGKIETVYVTLNTNKSYRYDVTNQIFVRLDEEPGINYTPGDGITIMGNEISTDNMAAEDMSEIVSPLPGVMSRMPILFDETGAERVVGWYKYSNGTKKPVYEKSISGTFDVSITDGTETNKSISCSSLNIDKFIGFYNGIFAASSNQGYYDLSSAWTGNPSANSYQIRLAYFDNESLPSQIRVLTNRTMFYNGTYRFTIRYTKTTDIVS